MEKLRENRKKKIDDTRSIKKGGTERYYILGIRVRRERKTKKRFDEKINQN